MAFDLEPLGDRVIVKVIEEEAEMTGSGLHIPEIAQTKSCKGRIMAVGEGRFIGGRIEPLPVNEGDVILFSKYGGTEINLDGEEYLCLRFDELYLRQRLVSLVQSVQ